MRLLFITWDGPQVTYLESLFLPIFRALQANGVETDVLQFRWGTAAQEAAVRAACEAAECGYRSVSVLRRGSAAGPILTSLAGGWHIRKAVHDFESNLLMPRSLMPALATLAAGPHTLPIMFDADGLAADEKVEFSGLSPTGPVYRALRWIETATVRRAKGVFVRSDDAATTLGNRAGVPVSRFHTVTNGRDEQVFKPLSEADRMGVRRELAIPTDAPLIVYAGSVGPQYCFPEMAAHFAAIRANCPNAYWLVLTGSPERAFRQLRASDHSAAYIIIRRVSPEIAPRLIGAADAGLSFRAITLSTRATAPVKIGEYLLCGVPVIGTASVGDNRSALDAGLFFDISGGPRASADWFANVVLGDRERFRKAARGVGIENFSLNRSVQDYLRALKPFVDA